MLLLFFLFTSSERGRKIRYLSRAHLPEYPMNTWNKADTAIAPDSSLIRTCHSSSCSAAVMLLMTFNDGHLHCGNFKIANVGTRNEIVPPCTIGSLLINR